MSSARALAAGAALLTAGLVTACGSAGSASARLAMPAGTDYNATVATTSTRGVSSVIGDIVPCLTGGGPVTVLAVGFTTSGGGMSLQGWGAQPNPLQTGVGEIVGMVDSTLARQRVPPGPVTVSNRCGTDQISTDFEIQVTRLGTATAWGRGITFTYLVDGHARELHANWDVALCGNTDPPGALSGQCGKHGAGGSRGA